jgi:hypothetical protein
MRATKTLREPRTERKNSNHTEFALALEKIDEAGGAIANANAVTMLLCEHLSGKGSLEMEVLDVIQTLMLKAIADLNAVEERLRTAVRP